MRRFALASFLAVACTIPLVAAPAAAQSGPGLPGLVYDSSELFQSIARLGQLPGPTGNHGHSMMFDGYLAVVAYSPGQVDFYDFSNPYDPRRVKRLATGIGDLSEPHTYAVTDAYGGAHLILLRGPGGLGGTGFAICDLTDVLDPGVVNTYDIPGVPGGYATGTFWMFYQAPYVYCGAGSLGLFVIDASDPSAPFVAKSMTTSQTGGFNAVNTLAVGNLLILTNSDGGPGMARLDISDPIDPQLVYATTSTSIPYGIQLNADRLLVPAVSGPIGGGGNNGVFEVRDPFQSTFPIVNQLVLPSRGGSVVVQDDFAHVAASLGYQKIDISDDAGYTLAGSMAMPNSGGDWDWVTPMGNLAVLGDDQGFGTTVVPHAALPDNTGPVVTMVVPQPDSTQQALTSRIGITLSDMVEMASIDQSSFSVRPIGGAPIPGSYSNQFGIVNFTPAQPLAPNTTYEVSVPAFGLRDWSGNATATSFTSRFATGSSVTAINAVAQPSVPREPGQPAFFDLASVSGPGPFQFSWSFGDGSPSTPLSNSSQAVHTYTDAGHYSVVVTVTNGTISGTDAFLQTVHHPLTPARPSRSSTITIDEANGRVWCVNADNDSVTALSSITFEKELEVSVGQHPRTLALAPDGTIWVVCQDDASVHVLDAGDGSNLTTIELPYASAPYGIAFSPDGSAAFVTLRATGRVAKLDPAGRSLVDTTFVGPEPKGIAIAADSERVFVTRFISTSFPTARALTPLVSTPTGASPVRFRAPAFEPSGEVYELSAGALRRVRSIPLALDPGPDTEAGGRGLPNYLSSIAISPDGRRAWVPSKKDNIQRGLFRDGNPLNFESTTRTIVSQIELGSTREDAEARIDFNDRDMAFAVEFSPLGDYAFLVLQGSNAVDVRDAYSGAIVAGIDGTGLAPQGLALTSDGSTLFVHNFMSRSVAIHDASGVTSSTSFAMPLLETVSTVAVEALPAQVLRGKKIFYNARDPRMNEDGYISCASCHLDGEHDGRTWDFTDRGEGLRNTISLKGKAGLGHGRVHWTANFDEIQDFENDMRDGFGGDGFLHAEEYAVTRAPLGAPKAGLSEELDALAAYVSSLERFGLSPDRNSDGTLTAAASRGKLVFEQLNCAQCHSGAGFTDSPSGAKHDVGTLEPGSGTALGEPIVGLDTPTLRGLWATAPYLHDGSARTLMNVVTTANPAGLHGATGTLTREEQEDLVAYLRQIDDLEPAPSGSRLRASRLAGR